MTTKKWCGVEFVTAEQSRADRLRKVPLLRANITSVFDPRIL